MIWTFKLLLALSTLFFMLGFVARHREPNIHPRLMGFASLLLLGAMVTLGVARFLGVGAQPALYIREWLGEEPTIILSSVFIGLGGLALFGCGFQMLTGVMRHPWHRLFPRFLLPLLVFFFIGGMFGYY